MQKKKHIQIRTINKMCLLLGLNSLQLSSILSLRAALSNTLQMKQVLKFNIQNNEEFVAN